MKLKIMQSLLVAPLLLLIAGLFELPTQNPVAATAGTAIGVYALLGAITISYAISRTKKLNILPIIAILGFFVWGNQVIQAQVAVINEVQVDPANGENGRGEFIELYCPPGAPCNVGCNIIASDDGDIFTIPSGTIIPAGGYLVIYTTSASLIYGMAQASGDFNGWTTNIGPNVLGLDLSTCTTCTTNGLAYDNFSPTTTINSAGQRIVMFAPTGAIVDAFAYGSQAGAYILSGLYTEDPDGCGVGVVGTTAGAQPEGFAYTYGTCGGFAIPNTNAGCPPPVGGVTLPARGDAAYEVYAGCPVGCNTSIARQTDGSLTWVDDNSPTPGKPNDSAAADVIATATSGTCTLANFALKNYDIRHHETVSLVDNITVCPGNAFSVTFTAHMENFADINNGVANASPSGAGGSTTVNSTRTATSNPAPTISAPNATGVRTVTQTTTFNAAAMTAGTFTLTFVMRESTKGDNGSSGSECYYRYAINVTVTDIAPPTAPASTASACYNGVGTITLPFAATPPASPVGSTIEWFDAPSGGSSLGTGNTINIPGFVFTGPYPQTATRYAETVSADGCCRSLSRTAVDIVINQAPTITAASNSPICVGDNILLTSTPTNTLGTPTFTWDSPTTTGFSTLEDPATLVATAALGGTYSVTVTNGSNTCTATASTVVVVNPLPVVSASSNSPVCAGSPINLSATTDIGTSFAWSGPNGFTTALQNPTIAASTTANAGVYTITVTSAGCTATASTTVAVNPVTADITNNTGSIELTCTLTAISVTATGGDTYAWSNGTTTAANSLTAAGTYTVTVTATNGCTATASIAITSNTTPPTFTGTASCAGGANTGAVSQSATGGSGSGYTYAITGGSFGSTLANGTYNVTVTDSNGCSATSNVVVNCVDLCPDLTAAAPAVQVTESTCTSCAVSGGAISAPATTCPAGSTLQYSTDNGTSWSTILPTYNQTSAITVLTRCNCNANTATSSPTSSITTVPGTCTTPVFTSSNASLCVNVTRTLVASPAGGTFSLVSGTATLVGTTLTATGAGAIAIQYTATNGCTATQNITATTCGTRVVSISDPCSCNNNATTLTNGTFNETVHVDDLIAGDILTVTAINGLYASAGVAYTPTTATSALVITLPTANLSGIHTDNVGYSLTIHVSNTTPGSEYEGDLSISNKCAYPDPDFTLPVSTICSSGLPIALTATHTDAGPAGVGVFSGAGVSGTTFTPSVAGVGGPYSITLTYTGGNDGLGGISPDGGTAPAYPGCVQPIGRTISVTDCCEANQGTWID